MRAGGTRCAPEQKPGTTRDMRVDFHLPKMHFPPPVINPAEHPWMAKAANLSLMTVGRVIVPAVAVPIATNLSGDHKTHWLPDMAISAALGAAIGGAAGLWFPMMERDTAHRADAVRGGVMSGMFGAPAVSLAVMGTARFFLKDLLPYGGAKVVPSDSGHPQVQLKH